MKNNPYGRKVEVRLGWQDGKLRLPDKDELHFLQGMARKVRRHVIEITNRVGTVHVGGSFSAVDILTVLYFWVLRLDPLNPRDPLRDRFVLSKGHAAAGLYSLLAERGFLEIDRLFTYLQIDSILQGHPDRQKTPGIEISSGPLGMGLSVAAGMALAARLDKVDCRVFALLSDGENQAGMTWEAAMLAGHRRLGNLTAFVDYNRLQLSDFIANMVDVAPLPAKWRAFNWNVIEIDGHNIMEIINGINQALSTNDQPTVLIAHTVKGKGVSFMENIPKWHHGSLTKEEYEIAMAELADPEVS